MGSASREALAQASTALRSGLQPGTGPELLQAAGELSVNAALASALGDALAPVESKTALIEQVFGSLGSDARAVLISAASERWSNAEEFVDGVEDLGIRAAALAEAGLTDELLAVADVISSDHALQLNLGSKLIPSQQKHNLIDTLFAGKVSDATLAVTQQIVTGLSSRRVDSTLRQAARIAADQGGSELATVTVAAPLSDAQSSRLSALLEQSVGRPVKVTTIVDPELIGGVHIEIADDVIDGSVRARLEDLRQQLAA